ncbi:MAG: Smr/MutS family protein [Prolixibacteraceae bacterium]|nr:Smr/MutS family protein [Prolixibacteraceae bacterium]
MQYIYPANFEQKIGFERIRQILSNFCLSEMGRENVARISFMNDFSKIVYHTTLVDEFLTILVEYDNFPTGHYYDMRGVLNKIRVQGTFIEPDELFDLRRSLDTIRGIIYFFKGEKGERFPNLKELTTDIEVFQNTVKAIDAILDKQGKIKDNASPELREIRSNIFSLQSSISKRMQQIIRQLQAEGVVDEDAAVAMREGRPVVPVASANKKKISGIVHDESASGKTAFIEPGAIVEMNNRLRELHNAERREIIKILTTFADNLRPDLEEIAVSYVFLGRIDFIRAKAKLARQFECVKPDLRDEPFFDWHHARHPLLVEALAKENKEMVPLKIRMDEPNRILLISGPNAGGKSVCLKTVGIIQYMLQCGLLIPLAEGSRVGIFKSVFIDIGDEQSIENDLSTYSSHLMHMKFFTQNCSKNSLVLIDEFGTGTEPMLGGAIAEAVLNRLNKLETYGIITTHYTNLKHFGSANKGIVNGAMLYNTKEMRPLFELQIGKPGSSFAFEIARSIGLQEDILKEATDKLGKEHVDYDKNLREIVRDKHYWESKRHRIRKVEKSLDSLSDEYQNELDNTRQMRKEIVAQAKKEAKKILEDANRTIENTIREIRESQAEKERTKEIRKNLTTEKDKIEKIDPEKEKKIAKKMEQLQRRQKKKGKKKKENTGAVQQQPATKPPKTQFNPGDKVRLKDTGSVGEIIDIDKSKVVVALGNLVSTISIDKIEPVSNNDVKRQKQEDRMKPKSDNLQRTNSILGKKMEFKPDIDVRGQRADEALSNIQAFIDEAIMVGASKLRILHGKGYGILKEVIRNYLKTEPAVKSVKDEHVQFGGSGITIVELD